MQVDPTSEAGGSSKKAAVAQPAALPATVPMFNMMPETVPLSAAVEDEGSDVQRLEPIRKLNMEAAKDGQGSSRRAEPEQKLMPQPLTDSEFMSMKAAGRTVPHREELMNMSVLPHLLKHHRSPITATLCLHSGSVIVHLDKQADTEGLWTRLFWMEQPSP